MTKTISILVCEPMAKDGLAILKNARFNVDEKLGLNSSELKSIIGNYDAILVRSQTTVDRDLIGHGKRLRLIGRAGTGIDNIDIAAANDHNITVINTPAGNSISTAEMAFALVLSLARNIPFAHQSMKDGKWLRSKLKGMEVSNKTLGLLGFGNVGRQVARRARAFDMHVIAHDPKVSEDFFREFDTKSVSQTHLLAESDFLSLHCNLDENTKNIINEDTISRMKRGAYIINGARGELIDNNALINALNSGHIAGAALDVFPTEPPSPTDTLVHHEKVIATPHLGASTEEAQRRVSVLLAEQTLGFFS